jgi:cytochrome c peroxidase
MAASTPSQPEQTPPQQPRKHGVRTALTILLVLLVVLLIPPVSNLLSSPAKTPLQALAAGNPKFQNAIDLLERNCMDCHSEKAKLPFYAALPIAKDLIQKDVAAGLAEIDLVAELAPPAPAKAPLETALAKIEYVMDQGTMPPTRYRLLHWNRGLSEGDHGEILAWIRKVRMADYGSFKGDGLQPLPRSVKVNAAKAALGGKLFHDVRLSGDSTLSCASCHALDKGGVDRKKSSTGIKGAIGPINSPTVYNAVFHVKQFWDGRAEDLKQQAAGPVENPIEMGAKWDQVIPKLKADDALMKQFSAVYPEGPSTDTVTDAIAEFERTLVTPDSSCDVFLRADPSALNEDEMNGLQLFRDNGCYTCHIGKNFGGQSFERMGRRADYFGDRGNPTEVDNGRYNVTKKERDRHAFKVPTLRNVALTYPYFHDGSQATLGGAVKAMARYQTGRPLTDQEVGQIVAFLKSLTGKYNDKPLE